MANKKFLVPDGAILLHDVIQLLHERSINDKMMQEEIIKRYLPDKVIELENILDYYNQDYTCDFAELKIKNLADLSKGNFQPINTSSNS